MYATRRGFQSNCALTYSGKNILLPTDFYKTLLQVHILAITDPDAPADMYWLLTPPSSVGPLELLDLVWLVPGYLRQTWGSLG